MQRANLLLLSICFGCFAQSPPNLDVLADHVDGRHIRTMLPRYLRARVLRARQERDGDRETFRNRLIQSIGGFPPRAPLNARTVGTIELDGYHIEKIVFESQPGFFVTANLYMPAKGHPPFPAILFPIGHELGGKAYPIWQQILGNFAKRGYVALTWDTLGQGERVQHFDEALGDSKVGFGIFEHTILGAQCLLAGDAIARYMIWDGVRALDYLVSRPEVDPRRVGLTGNSGGGTLTAYLAAVDDRFQVAASSCFLTSWEHILETIGPQDAEQCPPGFLGFGYDHIDLVGAFSPKPFLFLSAIKDFFSIRGARRTYQAARKLYGDAGHIERVDMVEANESHGYSSGLRNAAYAWFDRWLKGVKSYHSEELIEVLPEDQLWCTRTGQVSTSLGGQTVHSLNRDRVRSLARTVTAQPAEIQRMIRWREVTEDPNVQLYGTERWGELTIEKLVIESEPGIMMPAVIVSRPGSTARRTGVVLASGSGKASAWPEIAVLAEGGAVVLAVDLRGFGESRPSTDTKGAEWTAWFGDYDSAMTAVLLGDSLTGLRAFDIQRAFYVLAKRPDVDPKRIGGVGQGPAAVAMLHAASSGVPFSCLGLDGMLVSYRSVVEAPINRGVFETVVPGALRRYDLPELTALVAPRPVVLIDANSPMGAPLLQSEVRSVYSAAQNTRAVRRLREEVPSKAYRVLMDVLHKARFDEAGQ